MTRGRLAADLLAAVDAGGGRAALVDLPGILNVDPAHVDAVAADLVGQGTAGLTLAPGGALLLPSFWRSVAAEVGAALACCGPVAPAVGDLAARFGLAADTLVAGLAPHMADGGSLVARVEGGRLVSPATVARARAALRGALRGAAAPVSLAALGASDASASTPTPTSGSLALPALADSLVAAGEVAGRVRPGGSWVPAVHEAAAAAALSAAWARDGLVEYGRVVGSGQCPDRRSAAAHLAATLPGGVTLEGAYVGPAVLAAVEAAAAAGLVSGAWADVHASVPPSLTRSDTAALLGRTSVAARLLGKGSGGGSGDGGLVLAGTCVVSAALLADLAARAGDLGRAAGFEAAAQPAWKKAQAASVPAGGGGSDDDWSKGRKGGGRKGGKGGGRPKASAAAPSSSSSSCQPGLTLRALTARCGAWVPGAAAAGAHEEEEEGEGGGSVGSLASALAAHVRPAALAAHEQAVADAASGGASSRRRAREAAVKAAAEAGDRLQLYARGAEALVARVGGGGGGPGAAAEAAAALAPILHRHLVRGPGAEAVDGWLAALLLDAAGESGGASGGAGASAPFPPALTPAARAAAVSPGAKLIPADALAAAGAAVGLLAAASAQPAALVDALEALATAAGGRARRLDRKAEKGLVASVRAGLAASVAGATDPAAALPAAAALAFTRVTGRAVSVPGRALGALIGSLEGGMGGGEKGGGVAPLLREFHSLTVAHLRGDASGEARLAELLPAVRAMGRDG